MTEAGYGDTRSSEIRVPKNEHTLYTHTSQTHFFFIPRPDVHPLHTHEEESHRPEPCHYLPQLPDHQFTYRSHHKYLCNPNQISGPVTPQ
jgi:hypothetical protein